MNDIQEIKRIIAEAENIVFFGGAGVSTDSGIPDFRGNGGLYTDVEEFDEEPETILSATYLHRYPSRFYRYYRNHMVYPYAEPNDAHYALAKLEEQGKLSAVITQNIDGLHQMAGSEKVYELHGSVLRNYCMNCGEFYDADYIRNSLDFPICKKCGGIVKPDVVLYEEGLDDKIIRGSIDAISKADCLILGGTSLTVQPAASLVQYFSGKHLVIINKGDVFMPNGVELLIKEKIGEVLDKICC
jgi:NAD-dependent deacetylase